MRKIKFNIKDRKMLYTMLSLVLVCVFTLTIAYSALSAVLTIQGNARVSAADWDIYLNNPRVTNGSATTNVPEIKTSSTLEFSTTLNMPGDFYEFVVDVVNSGDIDAMIENVVKTPDLTEEQAKFLKYEVSYQNGESITTKQLLAKDTTMPIKVRVEYRKDLSDTDLPTEQVVLDFALTLEYVQSDGSGSSVNNNGVMKVVNVVSGDGSNIGDILQVGTEKFYVIENDGEKIKMFTEDSIATSIFSETKYWEDNVEEGTYAYVYNEQSSIYPIVQNYKTKLESFGLNVLDARLASYEEMNKLGCDPYGTGSCGCDEYEYDSWLWADVDAYFIGSVGIRFKKIFVVNGDEIYEGWEQSEFGVRPVIVISASEI